MMIYCVEDEKNIRELLVYTLGGSGFEAKGLSNGKELKKALKEEIPELILLDIMLPGEDGYAVLEYLKGRPDTRDVPVIMVTAKEEEDDKVRGLEGGADDFITKPFGMMEFLARIKAVLRRSKKQEQPKEYHCRGLTVDVKSRKVWDEDRSVDLTLKEFELLRYLLENRGTFPLLLRRDPVEITLKLEGDAPVTLTALKLDGTSAGTVAVTRKKGGFFHFTADPGAFSGGTMVYHLTR